MYHDWISEVWVPTTGFFFSLFFPVRFFFGAGSSSSPGPSVVPGSICSSSGASSGQVTRFFGCLPLPLPLPLPSGLLLLAPVSSGCFPRPLPLPLPRPRPGAAAFAFALEAARLQAAYAVGKGWYLKITSPSKTCCMLSRPPMLFFNWMKLSWIRCNLAACLLVLAECCRRVESHRNWFHLRLHWGPVGLQPKVPCP